MTIHLYLLTPLNLNVMSNIFFSIINLVRSEFPGAALRLTERRTSMTGFLQHLANPRASVAAKCGRLVCNPTSASRYLSLRFTPHAKTHGVPKVDQGGIFYSLPCLRHINSCKKGCYYSIILCNDRFKLPQVIILTDKLINDSPPIYFIVIMVLESVAIAK